MSGSNVTIGDIYNSNPVSFSSGLVFEIQTASTATGVSGGINAASLATGISGHLNLGSMATQNANAVAITGGAATLNTLAVTDDYVGPPPCVVGSATNVYSEVTVISSPAGVQMALGRDLSGGWLYTSDGLPINAPATIFSADINIRGDLSSNIRANSASYYYNTGTLFLHNFGSTATTFPAGGFTWRSSHSDGSGTVTLVALSYASTVGTLFQINDLPTASGTLAINTLWNNAGTVRIVT